MTQITPEIVTQHGLTTEEYEKIRTIMGREPNITELGVFSVMWSEHCSYKSSRVHLKRLPTTGRRVIVPPGENAGVIDIGDDWCVAFKVESHNHPSFIEPFQGAATGVGGILRDVFTMGARPIAAMNSLRFGPLDDPQNGNRNKSILKGCVEGIGHYGNCFGVPTIGGEVAFDEAYNLNPLVKDRDDSRQFVIEVQWAVSGYCKNSAFAKRLRDRARTVMVDGIEIRVPCLEDLFLHALLDTLAHEFEKGIKSLCDLNYMYRTCGLKLRWEQIVDEIAALGIRNEAELVFVLLDRLMGCSVDASVKTDASDIPDCIITSAEERLLRRRSDSILFWKLLASSGWRQRFDFARDGLKNSGETADNAVSPRRPFTLRSIRQFIRVIKSIPSASDIIQNERAQMMITGWINKQNASRDPAV